MTADVAIFTHNRPYHTTLCFHYLFKQNPCLEGVNFVAYDDCSTDADLLKLLRKTRSLAVVHLPDSGFKNPVQRIGMSRKFAVDAFLQHSQSDFLMLLDSDIVVTQQTITEAVQDYIAITLHSHETLGALTLFPLAHLTEASFVVEDKKFIKLEKTGEAHVIFSRESLLKTGNHFGIHEGGFADAQFKAIYDLGMPYVSRINPQYQVQHIGFGRSGSTMVKQYWWCMRPYWTTKEPKRVLQVQGFDVLRYSDHVNKFGATKGIMKFLQEKRLIA